MSNKTKFPGKPSKLVNKKRVSVLSFESFDRRASDQRESENSASPKHEHGYQVNPEKRLFFAFSQFSAEIALEWRAKAVNSQGATDFQALEAQGPASIANRPPNRDDKNSAS